MTTIIGEVPGLPARLGVVPEPFPLAIVRGTEISAWMFDWVVGAYMTNLHGLLQQYPELGDYQVSEIPRRWVAGLTWNAN